MTAIIPWLLSNWRIIVGLALVAGIGYASWWLRDSGVQAERLKWEVKISKAHEQRRAEVSNFVVDMSARNAKLSAELAASQSSQKIVTQTLIKEVPIYVSKFDDERCIINAGFVQHHDNAARGVSPIPAPSDKLAREPSGIALSEISTTVTYNYGKCIEWRNELTAFRKWYEIHSSNWKTFRNEGKD